MKEIDDDKSVHLEDEEPQRFMEVVVEPKNEKLDVVEPFNEEPLDPLEI